MWVWFLKVEFVMERVSEIANNLSCKGEWVSGWRLLQCPVSSILTCLERSREHDYTSNWLDELCSESTSNIQFPTQSFIFYNNNSNPVQLSWKYMSILWSTPCPSIRIEQGTKKWQDKWNTEHTGYTLSIPLCVYQCFQENLNKAKYFLKNIELLEIKRYGIHSLGNSLWHSPIIKLNIINLNVWLFVSIPLN